MNALVFQLAVVFVPGLAWLAIVDHLTAGSGRRNTLATGLRAFAFGAIGYFSWFLLRAMYVRFLWGVWPALPNGLKGTPGIEYVAALRAKDIVGTTIQEARRTSR